MVDKFDIIIIISIIIISILHIKQNSTHKHRVNVEARHCEIIIPTNAIMSCLRLVPTLHVNSFLWVFFQIQFVLNILSKQVSNLLIVDFQVRSMDEILDSDGHLNSLKNVIKCPKKQTQRVINLLQQFKQETIHTNINIQN